MIAQTGKDLPGAHGCLPTARQQQLLQAAAAPIEIARPAWEKWRAEGDLDEVGSASGRLLLWIYHRRDELGLRAEDVAALEPLHIYSEKIVRDRFTWEGKGMASGSIHVALVRIRKLAEPWEFAYEAKYGGCRSWINLPEPPAGWQETARPVIDDVAFAAVGKPDSL